MHFFYLNYDVLVSEQNSTEQNKHSSPSEPTKITCDNVQKLGVKQQFSNVLFGGSDNRLNTRFDIHF